MMFKTTDALLMELSNYANPKTKISRMVKNGEIIKIKRGLYETDPCIPAYLLAPLIYRPSYISFEYALARYGLIPERVYACTSATFGKMRSKLFNTPLGIFSYRDIPREAYPYGKHWIQEEPYDYYIATPEKAICDTLYEKPPVGSVKALREMLFDDMRIDEEAFAALDAEAMIKYAVYYCAQNNKLLTRMLKRGVF